MPLPFLTAFVIALIVTGASSTSYVYKDQIFQVIEVNGRGQNGAVVENGVAIEPPVEKITDPKVLDDYVLDTAAIPEPLVESENAAIDKTASKGKRAGGSNPERVTRNAGSDHSSQSVAVQVNELEDSNRPNDIASTSQETDDSSSTSVTTYSSSGGNGGGGSSRSREDRAANDKPTDESNGKKDGSNNVPSGGATNSTSPGGQTNSTKDKPDTAKPKVAITFPGGRQVVAGMLNVTGTASDTGGNVTKVEVRIGQSPYKKAIPLDPTWSDWYAMVEIKNGPAKIEARARDSSGNIQKFSVSVVGVPHQDPDNATGYTPVVDTVPPTISSPPNLEREATGLLTKISSLGVPAVSDNSGNIASVTNNASLGFALGTTTIEWVATDSSGNSAVAYQNVTIMDTTAPSFVAPADITVESNSALTQVSLQSPKVTDNYDSSPTLTNNEPEKGFPVGTTSVTWTAVDSSGNKATASHEVTVTEAPDIVLPVATASPEGGLYSKPVSIQLASSAPSTVIFYTLDGSTPGISSAKYSLPISISSTTILKFIARAADGSLGPVQSETFTIDARAPKVTASPAGGTFSVTKSVTLTASEPATIFYSTDGTTPTASSSTYSSPIGITSSSTLKYFARDIAGNQSPVQTQTYIIDMTVPTVTASPSGGTFSSSVSVTLKTSEPSATIFYTNDGSKPTTSSMIYSSPITVSASATLKFFVRDAVGNTGIVSSQVYIIDLVAPTVAASPEGGTFSVSKSVSLSASEPGAAIFFTTDGSAPTEASRKYSTPISISSTTMLRYFAKDPAGNSGIVSSQKYVIDKTAPQVSASPTGGLYGNALSVSLKSNEAGAAIYYTMDGSTPTVASARYSQPLSVSASGVLKYFARDLAGNVGAIASQKYTIDIIAPKITPPPSITREATGPMTLIESLGTPTVTDNIGPIKVSNNASSLSFPVGATKVLWTATDAAGNRATAVQLISVKDTRAPSLVAPADKSAQITDENDSVSIPLGLPAVSDLVDPSPSVSNNAPPRFPLGTTYVTWAAMDDSGNQATAVQKVSVSAMPQPEEKKLLIRIMTINNDEATRAVIRDHLDEDDFINNFRLPVLGMYPGQIQALNEQSIEDVRTAIASEIPASRVDVDYIEYDNEAGNGDLSTPESELVDPAASTNQAMKIIHDAGYKSGVAPTRRILMQELGGVQWANVDYVVMQLQKVVGTQEFRDIADKVSTTTRKQNPDIVIFAQINPALNSVEEIVSAVNSVRDDIDGVGIVWTTSDATLLDRLLTALGR